MSNLLRHNTLLLLYSTVFFAILSFISDFAEPHAKKYSLTRHTKK